MTISNPIIRIVDDEAVIRKALKFLLESEGWAVEAYEKGSEFLVEDRPSLGDFSDRAWRCGHGRPGDEGRRHRLHSKAD